VAVNALAALLDAVPAPAALGIDGALVTSLTTQPVAAIGGLLGVGPGLTPAGDDVIAGFLLGTRALGLAATSARVWASVADMAHDRTTSLSAALLWHAARGECISEVAAVLADPSDATLGELLRVGHTSGAALALGLASAASAALRARGEAA
jgi:hypothetical protein